MTLKTAKILALVVTLGLIAWNICNLASGRDKLAWVPLTLFAAMGVFEAADLAAGRRSRLTVG